MSSISRLALLLVAAALLSACEDPNRYPVTGEECGPADPVKTVDSSIASCVPAAT